MTTVFIDKFDDNSCPKGGEHDDKAAVVIYRTRKGQERYINQDKYLGKPKQFKHKRTREMVTYYPPKKIHERMKVIGGSVACSKCGCPAIVSFNPFLYGN